MMDAGEETMSSTGNSQDKAIIECWIYGHEL